MVQTERRAKDDFIGGKDFSRVRRFDDDARRARVLTVNSSHSVDVEKLEGQLKEKNELKQAMEDAGKVNEKQNGCRLRSWNEKEEELRQQRIDARRNLEDFWRKQHEDFQEKWKQRIEQRNPNDPVGIIPVKRYIVQDEETLRDAEVTRRVNDVRLQQLLEQKTRLQQELEEKEEYEHQQATAKQRWERKEADIENKSRIKKIELANEYLQKSREKTMRDKIEHDQEHMYEIPSTYFAQFGTRSR